MEKLLVCDALDERDFLRKKISSSIHSANFVAGVRKKDPKILGSMTREEFSAKAISDYQSIKDMIARYNRLDSAITLANATTEIETRSGKKMTRAAAIALRKAFNGDTSNDFTGYLLQVLKTQNDTAVTAVASYSRKADVELENLKSTYVGKDTTKVLTEDNIKSLSMMVEDLYGEMIDPIHVADEIQKLADEHDTLVKELDSAIKVSNATTYVEF